MKKIVLVLCLLVFLIMIAACGNTENSQGISSDSKGEAEAIEQDEDNSTAPQTDTESESSSLSVEQVQAIYQDLEQKGFIIEAEFYGFMDNCDDTVSIEVDGNKYSLNTAFKSIADLKTAIEAVFTKTYSEQNFSMYFSLDPPLYIDHNDKLYRLLWGGWGGRGPTDSSSINITSQTHDTITFTAITSPEVSGVFSHLNDYRIKKVDGSWRLDCPIKGEWGVELAVYATVIPKDGLNLRAEPSTNSTSLMVLTEGSIVDVYDDTSYPEWAYVGYWDADNIGHPGYVAIEYLNY